ncbi:MAG: ribosome hibernation-promoting factor, HPF/YfiA family [Rhodomicrobium sp.]
MMIKITGKNVDLGESLRGYAQSRVETALGKFSGRLVSGQISLEKNHDGFSTQCAIHLESGLDMQSAGAGSDAYAAVDSAMERLEKRLRRYKRRLKSHSQGTVNSAPLLDSAGIDYVIDVERTVESPEEDGDGAGAPAVIAEKPARVRAMAVSDAVMQMDLADQPFLVFRNAAHGGINVVYRRPDGNIGWIDPSGGAGSAKA